jgi:triacylglycerol lipase/cholesterol oxidase
MEPRVTFTEVMKGFVKAGQSSYDAAAHGGEPLKVSLDIATEPIDFFTIDPRHSGEVKGYIKYKPLGGKCPIEKGEVELLVDAEKNSRQIRYRLSFKDKNGAPHTLTGVKKIGNRLWKVWGDCSTLFTKLYGSEVDAGSEQSQPVEAAGIIRIHPLDFLVELTTFRGRGGSFIQNSRGVYKFARFFFGTLWDAYLSKPGKMRGDREERRIPMFSLRGVERADISTHYVTTPDNLTLSMLRFQREPSEDVVVLLHGLTTSTDMFIMPEQDHNIVNYLLDNGFTDVWSFDWRGSMRYTYDLFPSDFTMDDIAANDMPAAFRKIRQTVGRSARIHVICHCVGSLTFMMSLYAKKVEGITSIISNSLSLTPAVPLWSKIKLRLSPLMFPRAMDLSPKWGRFPRRSWARLLAGWISLWHPACDVSGCQIASFMWGSGDPALWMHENLHPITHDRTSDLFGSVNMQYFRHVRKMVSKGVAVKMYPNDPRYADLPNQYLDYADEIDTPILFVTGEHNGVFLDSNIRMFETLNSLKKDNRNELWVVKGYGHQDIFMGKSSDKDIFPRFLEFLRRHAKCAEVQPATAVA